MKHRIIGGFIFGALAISMLVLGIIAYNIALNGNSTPITLWVLESSIICFVGINLNIRESKLSRDPPNHSD